MNLPLFIREFFALAFLIVGLSHLLQPRLWAEHFRDVYARPDGPFTIALSMLPCALAVVLLHNIWVLGVPVLVTLVGWMLLIKCTVYLLWPRTTRRVAPEKLRGPTQFRIAGIACIVLGVVVGADLLREFAAALLGDR